jgi:phenylpropionate dioxygenase-like ring-hydroxylating dioxygenase large terminal subunit
VEATAAAEAKAWFDLGRLPDAGGEPRQVTAAGRDLVVWRTERGRLSVLDNSCPHQGSALSSGSVQGEYLRCVSHGYLIATDGWCDRAGLATGSHRTRESDGIVYAMLPTGGRPA